ncbi:MAG TPA: hypothetical protein VG097_07895 [Gemmata sp.]|jgi:hypothetical protein|nr:hypothetical protein [Gemmata sp.]
MLNAITPFLFILCPADDPVRVTVVIVLATSNNAMIDPKLTDLAKEVQKREPKLTGFQLSESMGKSIPIGESHTFELMEKQELQVKVEKQKDANGHISLTIKPPGLEKITYGCVCGKFFPVVTPHQTKTGEVLIIAVMAKPCTAGKKKD